MRPCGGNYRDLRPEVDKNIHEFRRKEELAEPSTMRQRIDVITKGKETQHFVPLESLTLPGPSPQFQSGSETGKHSGGASQGVILGGHNLTTA